MIPAQLMLNFLVHLGEVLSLEQQFNGAMPYVAFMHASWPGHPHVKKTLLFPIQPIGRIASNGPVPDFVCRQGHSEAGLDSNHNKAKDGARSGKRCSKDTGGTSHQFFRSQRSFIRCCTPSCELTLWRVLHHTSSGRARRAENVSHVNWSA